MENKDVVDAKNINFQVTIIGLGMFVNLLIKFLLKNLGYWDAVNWFILIEQILLSFYLLYLLFYKIPKYHDNNKKTDKKDYQNSVSLFLQLDLSKIFERVVTLTITNILFFLLPNAPLPAPFQLIVIGMITLNFLFWLGLKIFEYRGVEKLCCFKIINFLLFLLMILEICNLTLPLFLLINILFH